MTDIDTIINSRPWTICDIARATHVTNQAIYYHIRKKNIPAPTQRLGRHRYYSSDEARKIIEFFSRRWSECAELK